jgi:outer membrane protein assembly factor BamB
VGCRDDKLYALTPTGKILWVFPTGGDVDAVALAGDLVLAGSDDGTLYAIERQGGKLAWTVETAAPIRGAPLVRPPQLIVFGSLDGGLRAVDFAGKPVWAERPAGPINAPLVAGADARLYVATRGGRVMAYRPDGQRQWTFITPDHVDAAPAIAAGGRAIFGCNDARLRGLTPGGAPAFEFAAEAPIHTRPLLSGKRVIFADLAGNVYAVEPPP